MWFDELLCCVARHCAVSGRVRSARDLAGKQGARVDDAEVLRRATGHRAVAGQRAGGHSENARVSERNEKDGSKNNYCCYYSIVDLVQYLAK